MGVNGKDAMSAAETVIDRLNQRTRRGQRLMSELCEVVITAPDPDWLLEVTRQSGKRRAVCQRAQLSPCSFYIPLAGQNLRADRRAERPCIPASRVLPR